jgi:hypothetical protein
MYRMLGRGGFPERGFIFLHPPSPPLKKNSNFFYSALLRMGSSLSLGPLRQTPTHTDTENNDTFPGFGLGPIMGRRLPEKKKRTKKEAMTLT